MNQFKPSLHLLLVTLFTFALLLVGMRYVGDEKAPRSMAVHKADTVNVDVTSNLFTLKVITVTVGDTVTWTRLNGAHNVHADNNSFRLGEPPDNNPGSTWVTVSHTFTGAGTFLYYCDAHGASGGVGMSGRVIVQSGGSDTPISGLTATNDSPTVLGSATHFTATVTAGNNISYTWNFGDGASGTGATASHTYSTTGLFTATVTAVNSAGNQSASTLVNVSHAIVRLRNTAFEPKNITINVGERVTWLRVDGTHNVHADNNSFRLGEPPGNNPGNTWVTVSHTFTGAGTFLYYCDAHGASGGGGMSGQVIVQSGGDTPISGLTATNDSPTVLGSATHFTATVTAGNNISYTWNFGDGASGTGATTTHTYSATGLFTATVTAVNSAGNQSASTLVNVSHAIVRLRNAVFEPKNITINVGERVTWLRVDGTHNVRAADGSFRLGDANGNVSGAWKTANYTFTEAGAVAYYCELHGSASGTGMAGTVIVQGAIISQTLYLPLVEMQIASGR